MPSPEMMKRLEAAPPLHPGTNQEYSKLKGCPECEGRGWFCLDPFQEYNVRFCRCPTCVEAERYFKKHGELPEHIAAKMKASQND